MESYGWYSLITKPGWAPPAWIFGPVWGILYALIAVSFGYVIVQAIRKRLSLWVALPFVLNLMFNIAFTPIQNAFPPGTEFSFLATIDIFLVLGTLVWSMIIVWKHIRWVTLINIPYLLWTTFATILQISITVLN